MKNGRFGLAAKVLGFVKLGNWPTVSPELKLNL